MGCASRCLGVTAERRPPPATFGSVLRHPFKRTRGGHAARPGTPSTPGSPSQNGTSCFVRGKGKLSPGSPFSWLTVGAPTPSTPGSAPTPPAPRPVLALYPGGARRGGTGQVCTGHEVTLLVWDQCPFLPVSREASLPALAVLLCSDPPAAQADSPALWLWCGDRSRHVSGCL